MVMKRSWSIASSTRGFLVLRGGAPPGDHTVTNPSQTGWKWLSDAAPVTLRRCLMSCVTHVNRRSGLFGRGGVLRSRPLVTGDSVAASHCAQPLPICSAGRITARSRRGVVAAGLVTLALAARDQRLRNRPLAALSWRLLKGREPGGTPKGNRNLGNGRRGRTGERRTTGNQRKAGEGGEPGGQTGNRSKARGGNRRT